MPSKGGTNPYKGIPKSEWPAIKAGLKANPNSAQSLEGEPTREMLPDATSVPRETITERHADISPLTLNTTGVDAIPPNLFNAHTRKLVIYSKDGDPNDPVPGFRTYWFNDDGNRIQLALNSGWDFIDRSEVMMGVELGPDNKDLGSKVRYVVGTLRSGDPMYAYCMKQRNDIAAAHAAERQAVNERIYQSLRQGQSVPNPNIVPGGQTGWNAPPISIAAKTYR